jgi:hypothetical protein
MSYQDRTQEIKAGHLLDVIRERPAMYLGSRTLTGLGHFLGGFGCAEHIHGIEAVSQLPNDFHEWVAYRLHYYESTKGWGRMILEQTADESAALDRFYELLDEHRARQAQVVATIQGHRREYDVWVERHDRTEVIHKLKPERMALVAYTDDPGLFLTSEEDSDFSEIGRLFHSQIGGIKREVITVLDQEAFDRWLAEDERQWRSGPATGKKLLR